MTTQPHKSCDGKMFPPIPSRRTDAPLQGKAFSVLLGRPHGTVATERRVQVDIEQWDDCLACVEFDHCRKLAPAKLSLESEALRNG